MMSGELLANNNRDVEMKKINYMSRSYVKQTDARARARWSNCGAMRSAARY